jgi:hypothetical protein
MTIRKSIQAERSPEIAFRIFCNEMSQWWPGGFESKAILFYLASKKPETGLWPAGTRRQA